MFKNNKKPVIAPCEPVKVKSSFEVRVNGSCVKRVTATADDSKALTELSTLCAQLWSILDRAMSLTLAFVPSDDSDASEDLLITFNR